MLNGLEDGPFYAGDTADGGVSELSEGGLADVNIVEVDTTDGGAFVNDSDGDALALVY